MRFTKSLFARKIDLPLSMYAVAVALLAFALATSPEAAKAADVDATPEFAAATQKWLEEAVTKAPQPAGVNLRMEVSVGSLDSRLKLAPCARVEPHVPVGTRLWGKTRLGLRCVDGPVRWNVFLPIQVKAFGPAWVLRDNKLAGATLNQDDAMLGEVDWAEDFSPVAGDPSQWVGAATTRALVGGQAIRQAMVKPAQVFQAGTTVKLIAQGSGFSITADGQAITAGVVGQLVRIRMESGKIATGTVMDARTVQIEL